MKSDIIEELFAQYYNYALLYTISLCKNKTVAEDIVSGAFFKALVSADDTIENFKSWLLAVCRNEYLMMLRKSRRRSFDVFDEDAADDAEQAIDAMIRDEEYRALYRAVSLLPDDQKEIVTLFYFSDIPVRSIASIVRKSESNVKTILFRARKNLKKLLED